MAQISYHTAALPPAVATHLLAVLGHRTETIPNGETIRLGNVLDQRYKTTARGIAVDWTGYVHHSSELAAALLESTLDTTRAGSAWASNRWTETCCCIWKMDETEKGIVAALAGEPLPLYPAAPMFNAALRRLIALPAISPFFAVETDQPDNGSHYRVRPVGYDLDDMEKLALFTRKKDIRALDPGNKALLALITTAYNSDMAKAVFKGPGLVQKTGTAVAALAQLPDQVRQDAMRLIAAYSGW